MQHNVYLTAVLFIIFIVLGRAYFIRVKKKRFLETRSDIDLNDVWRKNYEAYSYENFLLAWNSISETIPANPLKLRTSDTVQTLGQYSNWVEFFYDEVERLFDVDELEPAEVDINMDTTVDQLVRIFLETHQKKGF